MFARTIAALLVLAFATPGWADQQSSSAPAQVRPALVDGMDPDIAIGMKLAEASIATRDRAGAVKIYREMCDGPLKAGSGKPCTALGKLSYENGGRSGPRASFQTACTRSDYEGCYLLAEMMRNGEGGTEDQSGAHGKYTVACVMGKMPQACYNVGMYEQYTLRNPRNAAAYYDNACEGGVADACFFRGMILRDDPELKDVAAAKVSVNRSCTLGNKGACEVLNDPAEWK